jgi:fumarylacetoacetate (FAA) hydrolase
MKLGTLKSSESRDGTLVVVSRDNTKAVKATDIAPNLLTAMEKWDEIAPKLEELYQSLNEGDVVGAFDVKEEDFHSPLPRTWQWLDGSAFIHHIKLVRMARNAPLPETLKTVPLMYQGCSDNFLAPTEDIPQVDFSHGTDFEGEVGVILKDVPMGTKAQDALKYVALVVMINDVSLRGLIPDELKQGFGFMQSKPASSFGPFAVTPDELGENWKDGKVTLPLNVNLNGEFFGKANGGEMFFSFAQLIEHAAKTRHLAAGTILGSGTVSNENPEKGSSCLAEKRMLEKINEGEFKTPFMKIGDRVSMEVFNDKGVSLFGKIDQKVSKA